MTNFKCFEFHCYTYNIHTNVGVYYCTHYTYSSGFFSGVSSSARLSLFRPLFLFCSRVSLSSRDLYVYLYKYVYIYLYIFICVHNILFIHVCIKYTYVKVWVFTHTLFVGYICIFISLCCPNIRRLDFSYSEKR